MTRFAGVTIFENDMFAAEQGKGWMGFDFDGTIAHSQTAEPIDEMVRLAKHYIKKGMRVKIMTARVNSLRTPAQRAEATRFLHKWTRKHLGKVLEVTSEKDHLMIRLYDDRVVQVRRNTGEIVR